MKYVKTQWETQTKDEADPARNIQPEPRTRKTWKRAHCTMEISLWLRPWCKSYSGRCPPYGRIHTPAQAWQQIVRWSCFSLRKKNNIFFLYKKTNPPYDLLPNVGRSVNSTVRWGPSTVRFAPGPRPEWDFHRTVGSFPRFARFRRPVEFFVRYKKPERKPEPVDGLCGVSLSNQRENLSPSTLDGLEFLFDLDFHIFQ